MFCPLVPAVSTTIREAERTGQHDATRSASRPATQASMARPRSDHAWRGREAKEVDSIARHPVVERCRGRHVLAGRNWHSTHGRHRKENQTPDWGLANGTKRSYADFPLTRPRAVPKRREYLCHHDAVGNVSWREAGGLWSKQRAPVYQPLFALFALYAEKAHLATTPLFRFFGPERSLVPREWMAIERMA